MSSTLPAGRPEARNSETWVTAFVVRTFLGSGYLSLVTKVCKMPVAHSGTQAAVKRKLAAQREFLSGRLCAAWGLIREAKVS